MSEEFLLYFVGEIGALILGFCAIRYIGMSVSAKKLEKESQKLQLRLNNAREMLGEYSDNPADIIKQAVGDVGIDGLLDRFGIDPSILNNPVVKGLINSYAPKILEQLNKKGVKESPSIMSGL